LPKSTANNRRMVWGLQLKHLLVGIGLCLAAGGCASQQMAEYVAKPGKFRFNSCKQLDQIGANTLNRERELAALMERARQGAGGELAVAIAYQQDYTLVLGDLHEIEQTAAERNCELKFRAAAAERAERERAERERVKR